MATKSTKGKQPIKLRTKQLADGSQSLYLDCYVDGKRSYEFLKLYLMPEVGSRQEVSKIKAQNKNTMATAEAIKDQRYLEVLGGKDGITKPKVSSILLADWMAKVAEGKKAKGMHGYHHTELAALQLSNYNSKATLSQVDEAFCLGFVKYLQTKAESKRRKAYDGETFKEKPARLSNSSVFLYFNILSAALNQAVEEKLIPFNPIKNLRKEDKPKRAKETKTYLEIDEVKRLIATPCKNEMVKRAFLFACFTGLRVSDVKGLKWGDIKEKGGNLVANIIMQKTQKPFEFTISNEAAKWMPEQGEATDKECVFALPKHLSSIEDHLIIWANAAKIDKHITFHVSRHTFGTLMVSLGADIYTTQQLMGHSNISMTQVYAKIVDDAKAKAVNLVNDIF